MTALPCSLLLTLSTGDTFEITRVECDDTGNVVSLTLVPFVGPAITATLHGAMDLQSICNYLSIDK